MFRPFARNKFSAPILIFLVSIGFSFITRLCLLVQALHHTHLSASQIMYVFSVGLLYDGCIACAVMVPFVLQVAVANEAVYKPPFTRIAIGFFIILLSILFFTNLIPKEFSAELYSVVEIYIALRFIIYLILLSTNEAFRRKWRKGVLFAAFFLITFLLAFNAVAEWFFWDEFSARYNFIAVDYLIYTTEVIGNIKESYPITWIIGSVAVITLAVVVIVRKYIARSVDAPCNGRRKIMSALALLTLPVIAFNTITPAWMSKSENTYANELSGNGVYTFCKAFDDNELDFYKFYTSLTDSEAFANLRKNLLQPNAFFTGTDSLSIERNIKFNGPENRMNIVLVSIESLSADFMKVFGNTQNITPKLDSLAQHSLVFTNFYASGTRTVRGLEAITLSIPPTPGQSTIKRPGNTNLFSLGAVLRDKGYITQYIYGGYSYFDNMKEFFEHNGYDVIDRGSLKKSEIHYSNVWGVADEDLYTLSLRVLDSNYRKGKPFFSHIMTVSNHRPFTYPDGHIDIPSAAHTREGAVKYTDYALVKFIHDAQQKPWFSNTIFIIVADHCASSAGSVDLPVTGYHIPLLIYSPGHIKPQKLDQLTSQIDIAPTIMGFLKMDYRSKFFGKDVFSSDFEQRAFISTYQGLGFLTNNQLILLSPVKQAADFKPDFKTGGSKKTSMNDSLLKEAISYYQCASWLLKNKKYNYK